MAKGFVGQRQAKTSQKTSEKLGITQTYIALRLAKSSLYFIRQQFYVIWMYKFLSIWLGFEQNFKTHTNKLNSFQFNQNDTQVITAGRDNSIRIWDLRYIKQSNYFDESQCVQVFQQHKCQGYNIPAFYINGEKGIITGSENGKIIIYDISKGKVDYEYQTKSKICHLVHPISLYSNYQFAYSDQLICRNILLK
ncbi:hypothetical protein IMG5_134760 [Ichthyophthirius multifiliis]|uniref:Histone acetyltransferase n=1 Tax=Ichthyophthirius multifiliis TaxID=5932 RepID=G0QWS2_ICHMU|nr:hypothetical protein IMG5_134760 [Ichthyophthirius multifiliis]EGR30327.1 hypothetical protein IMG5_134760 [Ichthyophthirius multifiliis]|eukprot:XP_004031914.1 hypothetical protein IMG5_134760 [Ichthyophthirius multifiliis]